MKFQNTVFNKGLIFLLVASGLAHSQRTSAAADAKASDKERDLIRILQSDAPPQDKAIPCKQLAIYGTKAAVPALAALLPDPNLASWARIALEAIPDPAADEALRQALPHVKGKLLVGVINSLGVRNDIKAVPGLIDKLKDVDVEVASAAAEALGHIGGEQAASALERSLAAQTETRSAIAYGCLMCAEKLLAQGHAAQAMQLYDRLRQADLPKQRILEATRGAILARQSKGIPLLLEQLRSADRARITLGLGAARELPGAQVTQAILKELETAGLDKQVLFLQLLADRKDAVSLPKFLQLAQSGPEEVRTTALGLLDRFGGLSCVPVLLNAGTENQPDVSATAKATLARLGGNEIDEDLLARLQQATGKTRQVLIELARQRRIDGSLPVILQSTEDADEGIRRSALEAVGVMGQAAQTTSLIDLLGKPQAARDRDEIEKALTSICSRSGAQCLPQVLPLARNNEAPLRRIALRALASIGGSDALTAVTTAVQDPDASVENEAVRTLANWPNNWPEDAGAAEALLALVKTGKKLSHQVQGLRGYLQYLQEDKKLNNSQKLSRIQELRPAIQRPEEKRLIISTLGNLPAEGVLELLSSYAEEPEIAEEASLAIVKIADAKELKQPKEVRLKALQTVLDHSKSDNTRKQAEQAAKRLN